MKSSKFSLALACAAIHFCLPMSTQAQTITFLNRDSANSVIQGRMELYGTGGGGANDLGQISA